MWYRRPAVRDLAWLVLDGALDLPAGSGALETVQPGEAERAELLGLLAGWDQDPQDAWLGPVDPRLRLGLYAERLIGAWLRHSRLIRLVAMNWPLRENRITLGEADFLVERRGHLTGGLQLWELACKIYLGVPGCGWLGPGLEDSLAAKLSRIRGHQMQLIRHGGFRAAWGAGWTSRAWIAGWLLSPFASVSAGSSSPSFGRPRIAGVWIEAGDPAVALVERHAQALGVSEWWLLPKRRWLRPIFADPPVAQRFAGLGEAASFLARPDTGAHGPDQPRPLMLAGIRWLPAGHLSAQAMAVAGPGPVAGESIRLMLVPEGWSGRATRSSGPGTDKELKP